MTTLFFWEGKKKKKNLNYSYLMGNIAVDRLVFVIHWHHQQRTKSNVVFILLVYPLTQSVAMVIQYLCCLHELLHISFSFEN